MFGNAKGLPMRESKLLTRVLQPAAEAAGLGRVTWHQHSSLLNDLRVPVKIAQEQLGHASIATTLGIYTHVVNASHRKAVEDAEERLFGLTLGAETRGESARMCRPSFQTLPAESRTPTTPSSATSCRQSYPTFISRSHRSIRNR